MSNINIDPTWFLSSEGSCSLFASIKTIPEDFIVTEIPLNRTERTESTENVIPLRFQNEVSIEDMQRIETITCLDVSKKPMQGATLASESHVRIEYSFDELQVVTEIPVLRLMNSWLENYVDDVSIPKDECILGKSYGGYTKEQRKWLVPQLRQLFPYLKIDPITVDNSDSNLSMVESNEAPSNLTQSNQTLIASLLRVVPDTSLIRFLKVGLSVKEVCDLYVFRMKGPNDLHACSGVRIGSNLTKEQRTQLYKDLRSACASWDSKTIDVPNNAGLVNKVMIIYWKKKAFKGNMAIVAKSSAVENASDGTSISTASQTEIIRAELLVGFSLLKRDIEQLEALKRIADICSVSVADISYCGIKDKQAVTLQQCAVAVRAVCSHCPSFLNRGVGDNSTVDNQGNELSCGGGDESARESKRRKLGNCLTAPEPKLERPCALRYAVHDTIRALLQLSYQRPEFAEYFGRHFVSCIRPSQEVESNFHERRHLAVGNISLRTAGYNIGELWGNHFRINLRDIRATTITTEVDTSRINQILLLRAESIRQHGFPNYFGSQRMGVLRSDTDFVSNEHNSLPSGDVIDQEEQDLLPTGPLIGLLLLKECYEEAIHTVVLDAIYSSIGDYRDQYLSIVGCQAHGEIENSGADLSSASRKLFSQLMRTLPQTSTRARMILKAMIRYNLVPRAKLVGVVKQANFVTYQWGSCAPPTEDHFNVCKQILVSIPFTTRSLWISAYQSWIWNRITCCRLKNGGMCALAGDIVVDCDEVQAIFANQVSGKISISLENEGQEDSAPCQQTTDSMSAPISDIPGDNQSADTTYPNEVDFVSEEFHDNAVGAQYRLLKDSELDSLTVSQKINLMRYTVMPLPGSKVILPTNEFSRSIRSLINSSLFGIKDELCSPEATSSASCASLELQQVQSGGICKQSQTQPATRPLHPVPRGSYRRILQTAYDLELSVPETAQGGTVDTIGCDMATIQFKLPCGSFATALLRELLMNNCVV